MALMMKSVVFCPNIEKAKETYDIKFINPIKKNKYYIVYLPLEHIFTT